MCDSQWDESDVFQSNSFFEIWDNVDSFTL